MHVLIPVSGNPWHPRASGILAYSHGLAHFLQRQGKSVEFLSVGGTGPRESIATTPIATAVRGELEFARALSRYADTHEFSDDSVVVANAELYVWALRRARPKPRFALVSHGATYPTLMKRRPLAAQVFKIVVEPGALRQVDIVIAVSHAAESYFLQVYPQRRVLRIPIAIDTARFAQESHEAARNRWSTRNQLTLLFAGRLVAEKDPELCAAAFERVARQRTEARLLVAGTGPRARPFERLRSRLGGDRVALLGYVERDRMPSLFAAVDGLAITSKSEQFPTVVVESLASGTPVFGTAVGDIPSILVSPELGEVCDASPDEISSKILTRLPEMADVRHRNGILRRAAAEQYSWEKIGPQVSRALEAIGDIPRGESAKRKSTSNPLEGSCLEGGPPS